MTLLAHPGELAAGRPPGSPPRHRRPRDHRTPRRSGRPGRALAAAAVVHLLAAFALMPVAGHPYDLAALTGTSGAWLRWGVPLFYYWKFGFDLSALAIGAQSLSFVLGHLGLSGAAALAVAWKLPLVLADLLVGVVLADLGRRLRCRRPALIPVLWLISPVPLWVSAGHGQIESLTILSIVLSLDLLVRRRPLLAGVVTGMGIGVEYLPALVALVVVFWLCVSVMKRREACRFVAGCAGALAFCFGPSLSTHIGRTSLLAGLTFSARVASHPGHSHAAVAGGSSLWAVLGLSPGPLWLAAALSATAALVIALALAARRAGRAADRRRLGILMAGGLLLCVILLDPGSLPQFSELSLGGLCLVSLFADLSPAAIIIGPSLQLAAGLISVYGGSFQSYWYDMWAATGASGWPFPQSPLAAYWSARLGTTIVALGLLLTPSRLLGAKSRARLRMVVARSAIAVGALGSVFLAVWSLQPAFWQGVGPQGPATLADFASITAFQAGTVSMTPGRTLIAFSPPEALAAQESTVRPSLALTVTARPFFAQMTADLARTSHGTAQRVMIPRWARDKTQVRSLWVSVLLGRPAWRSPAEVSGGVPALVVTGRTISSGNPAWVAPGWAVVAYDVPASMVSARGQLTLRLREAHRGDGPVEWNGSHHSRWTLVSLRSGTAAVKIDSMRWHGLVTLPSPTRSWPPPYAEEAALRVALPSQRARVSLAGAVLGGRPGTILRGGLAWPSPGALDHTIDGPLLSALGIGDAAVLLGGALALGRRAAGTHATQAQPGSQPAGAGQPPGRHRSAVLAHGRAFPSRAVK
jgi:hypothetical protein